MAFAAFDDSWVDLRLLPVELLVEWNMVYNVPGLYSTRIFGWDLWISGWDAQAFTGSYL